MESEKRIDLYKMPRIQRGKEEIRFLRTNNKETEKSESDLKIREQIIEREGGGMMKQGRRKSMGERKEKSR